MFGLTPYNNRKNMPRSMRDGFFDIEAMFDRFFNDSMFPSFFNNFNTMRVDVRDNDKEYVIEADLPGVNKEDINIELRDNRLTISVQRNEITQDERDNYIRRERTTSSMSRTFWIDDVKQEDIKASFKNGVLTLRLPKLESGQSKSHRIQIE